MIEKIRKLNKEFEELESSEDTIAIEGENVDDWNLLDEMAVWHVREDMMRLTLAQQLRQLCQDVSYLQQPQPHHQQLQHQCQANPVSCQLWGHQTLRWRPPPPSTARKGRIRQQGRLMNWIARRMPNHLIDLS